MTLYKYHNTNSYESFLSQAPAFVLSVGSLNFIVSQEDSGEILHVNEDRSVTQRYTVVYLFVHHCMKATLLEELSKPFVAIPHKRGCHEVIRNGF